MCIAISPELKELNVQCNCCFACNFFFSNPSLSKVSPIYGRVFCYFFWPYLVSELAANFVLRSVKQCNKVVASRLKYFSLALSVYINQKKEVARVLDFFIG